MNYASFASVYSNVSQSLFSYINRSCSWLVVQNLVVIGWIDGRVHQHVVTPSMYTVTVFPRKSYSEPLPRSVALSTSAWTPTESWFCVCLLHLYFSKYLNN